MNPVTGVLGFIICTVLGVALLCAVVALWQHSKITSCMYDLPESVCIEKYSL